MLFFQICPMYSLAVATNTPWPATEREIVGLRANRRWLFATPISAE